MAARMSKILKPMLGRYLIITNTLTCGTLMAIGDVVVQKIEKSPSAGYSRHEGPPSHKARSQLAKNVSLDWHRVGRMFSIGLVLGPFNHGWYTILDKVLPGKAGKTVVKKILADQLVASPYFAFTFFMGMGTLEGKPLKSSFNELKAKFWHVYKTDWMVWPAAQAVNFLFIPTQFRVLYVSMVTLGWNIFLSYIKHKEHIERPKAVIGHYTHHSH